MRAQLPPQVLNGRLGQRDGENSVLDAVDFKDLAEARANERAQAVVHHREGRALARGAATEIASGDEDLSVAKSRIVQDKIAAWTARRIEAKIVQKRLAVIVSGPAMAAHVTPRQDHAGVDAGNFERR